MAEFNFNDESREWLHGDDTPTQSEVERESWIMNHPEARTMSPDEIRQAMAEDPEVEFGSFPDGWDHSSIE